MHKIITFFAVCLFSTSLIIIAFVILAIDTHPRVNRQIILTPEHIERAKRIIGSHHSPAVINQLSVANIHPTDADIVVNYLANRFTNGSAKISVTNQKARVLLSFPIPKNIAFNGYINFQATLAQTADLPRLRSIRIGSLALPDFLANFAASKLINWLQNYPSIQKSLTAIRMIEISPQKISITYRQRNASSLTQEIFFPLFSKNEQEQIYRYHEFLVKKSRQANIKTITLSEIILPLMHIAAKYSINGDALAENRAAILATTLHTLEIPLELFIPKATTWPQTNDLSVTLEGRPDFAKHFIASAAITAYTDSTLSNAIGLYKEIADSQHGSGFSFSDIAADLAGTRFGYKAVKNHISALQLQQLIVAGLNDTDLMPPWSDLPENMPEKEFKAHFGNTDTITYQNMMHDIENRVLMLRILR